MDQKLVSIEYKRRSEECISLAAEAGFGAITISLVSRLFNGGFVFELLTVVYLLCCLIGLIFLIKAWGWSRRSKAVIHKPVDY